MKPVDNDEHGYICGFPYHDGFLKEVLFRQSDQSARLTIEAVSGETNEVTLERVHALSVEGVCEGNIILNLRVVRCDVATGLQEMRKVVGSRFELEVESLTKEAMVFVLESSYGVEVLALCDRVLVGEL